MFIVVNVNAATLTFIVEQKMVEMNLLSLNTTLSLY